MLVKILHRKGFHALSWKILRQYGKLWVSEQRHPVKAGKLYLPSNGKVRRAVQQPVYKFIPAAHHYIHLYIRLIPVEIRKYPGQQRGGYAGIGAHAQHPSPAVQYGLGLFHEAPFAGHHLLNAGQHFPTLF